MKLSFHYCTQGLCNCYMLGNDYDKSSDSREGRDAVIIDPGNMDKAVLNFIESNEYTLRGVLVTHNHVSHVNGIRALKRIYGDVAIYAANSAVLDHKTTVVHDGDILDFGSFGVKAISVPGHSADSMVYVVDYLLFTGDTLSAGLTGRTDNSYSAMRQIISIQNKIFTLQGNYIVFPGHGPPTTLDVERRYNIGIGLFEESRNKTQHKSFSLELLE